MILFLLDEAEQTLRTEAKVPPGARITEKTIGNFVPQEVMNRMVNFYKPRINEAADTLIAESILQRTGSSPLQRTIFAKIRGIITDQDFYTAGLENTVGKGY